MFDPRLSTVLEAIIKLHRKARFFSILRRGLLTLCLVIALWLFLRLLHVELSRSLLWGSLAFVASVFAVELIRFYKRPGEQDEVVRLVESADPKLDTALLAAVETQSDPNDLLARMMKSRLVDQALSLSRATPWERPFVERLFLAQGTSLLAGAAFLTLLAASSRVHIRESRTAKADSALFEVTPGDVSVERGTALAISARFGSGLPKEAFIAMTPETGPANRVAMPRALNDGLFGLTLPAVDSSFRYRIETALGNSREYRVVVYDLPSLIRGDADVNYPDYTGLTNRHIPDTRRVAAVEGSRLSWRLQMNKPLSSARLLSTNQAPVALSANPTNTLLFDWAVVLTNSRNDLLELVDAEGRTNRQRVELVMEAVPNRRPDLRFIFPKGDTRASALQELSFQAEVSDDFGTLTSGLAWSAAGGEPRFIQLQGKTPGHATNHLGLNLHLEELKVEPRDFLTWFIWAEDIGPDGLPRRTVSELSFVEVRPFDELFKASQQSGSGEGKEGGSEAQNLLKQQKQIIAAGWNTLRNTASTALKTNLSTLKVAQDDALNKARALREKLKEPRMLLAAKDAVDHMQSALSELTDAATTVRTNPLPKGIGFAQSAYRDLLRLQGKEFNVSSSSSSSEGKGGESQSGEQKRQMDQLDFKTASNRYEDQSRAAKEKTKDQQERLSVLDGLKELAQRQQDLNDRLKENLAQQASTPEEQEEKQRQLKRLQDEQRELLQDMDELQQRSAKAEQSAQLSETDKQLSKSRAKAQEAADAMERGTPGDALSAGARAQRELKQAADDLRKKSSGQFEDQMKELRQQAREIATDQKQLQEKIGEQTKSGARSLRSENPSAQLGEEARNQVGALTNLLENMKRVTQQAESVEPLLARDLYEGIRQAEQSQIGGLLDAERQLLQRGMKEQASIIGNRVIAGIDQLQKNVERAAASVLGDEAESLRQARRSVEQLQAQAERESPKAQGGGGESKGNPPQSGQGGKPQQGNTKPGKGSQGKGLGGLLPQARAGGENGGGAGSEQGSASPFSSAGGFTEWVERLRDVETMIDQPALRQKLAEVRESARRIRSEIRNKGEGKAQESVVPRQQLLSTVILPLAEVQKLLTEALVRADSKEAIAPVDRDPVPGRYTELVNKYYERIGSGTKP